MEEQSVVNSGWSNLKKDGRKVESFYNYNFADTFIFSKYWGHKFASSYTDKKNKGNCNLKNHTYTCRTWIWDYAHWPTIPLSKCYATFRKLQHQKTELLTEDKIWMLEEGRLQEIHVLQCWTRKERPRNCFPLGKMYVYTMQANPSTISIGSKWVLGIREHVYESWWVIVISAHETCETYMQSTSDSLRVTCRNVCTWDL